MPRGGKRPGAGNPSGAHKAREWLRALCADPERRRLFEIALDAELEAGKTDAWFKAFAQGHGNAPQALDVRHGNLDGPITFRAILENCDAGPAGGEGLPASDLAIGGTD